MLPNILVNNFYQLHRLCILKFIENVHTKDPRCLSLLTLSVKKNTDSSDGKQSRYILCAQKSVQTQWGMSQIKMILA